ncbi:uncharacterized protein BDZ83DRAFT_612445 [Colletotrichum acutatum]|uniref:Secreted protein n=1 Tax=Glomerella acutata TaxID=27357 RepID=A0AAD8UQG9_GLOAC|nr:uncharacterized protein BDZ83DRAFT_612445 [Colletotrichum acutatum]KAK1727608.1 hypothetical protein BDZ83DRAFT_612445 [Colletotrichum acutatum]
MHLVPSWELFLLLKASWLYPSVGGRHQECLSVRNCLRPLACPSPLLPSQSTPRYSIDIRACTGQQNVRVGNAEHLV